MTVAREKLGAMRGALAGFVPWMGHFWFCIWSSVDRLLMGSKNLTCPFRFGIQRPDGTRIALQGDVGESVPCTKFCRVRVPPNESRGQNAHCARFGRSGAMEFPEESG